MSFLSMTGIPSLFLLYHAPVSIASTRWAIITHWTIKIVHYEVKRYVSRETWGLPYLSAIISVGDDL